jgi:hypothetical protein
MDKAFAGLDVTLSGKVEFISEDVTVVALGQRDTTGYCVEITYFAYVRRHRVNGGHHVRFDRAEVLSCQSRLQEIFQAVDLPFPCPICPKLVDIKCGFPPSL